MAFNPFDVFRRNQRILFAAITVVIMFTFILQFGQGDFFSLVPKWLASKRQGGETLAVVGGTKVTGVEVEEVQSRRQLANQYMAYAGQTAINNLRASAAGGTAKATAAVKKSLEDALAAQQNGFLSPNVQQQIQMAQFGLGSRPAPEAIAADQEQTIAFVQQSLANILNAKTDAADLDPARALSRSIDLQQHVPIPGRPGALYFANQPNATRRDALDFMLWLRKADQLGIEFAPADLSGLAKAEFFDAVSDDDWASVEKEIRQMTRFSQERLREALGDEFRVRAAQAAVLGQSAVRPGGRAYDAPLDYYRFYQKECVAATYGLIALPAASFLNQVAGEPDEATLRDLVRQAKAVDPDPASPKVGLREPRKFKVGFVEVKGDEPFYKAAAADAAAKAPVAAQLSGLLTPPVGGVSLATLLTAAPPLFQPNMALDRAYKNYAEAHRANLQQTWYSPTPFGPLPDTGFAKPPAVAGLVAGLGGNPLVALSGLAGDAVAADRVARLDVMPSTLIAPVMPGPGLLALALGQLAPQAHAAQPLPLAAVLPRLREQSQANLTRKIAGDDVQKFQKDLAALNAKADDPAAQKLAADFAQARGLKLGGSTQFRDIFSLYDDEGLKPLRDATSAVFAQLPAARAPLEFGTRFFTDPDPNPMGGGRRLPASGFFKPRLYPEPGAAARFNPPPPVPAFYAWRTAEQAAEPLRDLNAPESRAKVVAAWRMTQAKELAKKAAAEFAAKAADLGKQSLDIEQRFNDLEQEVKARLTTPEAKAGVRQFRVREVAPLVPQTPFNAGQGGGGVRPFQLRATDDIPYPTLAMQDALLKNKDKPLSTSFALADNPEATHYVAVLLSRAERGGPAEFALTVFGPSSRGSEFAAPVRQLHQIELRNQARENAVGLLRAEFGYEKESDKVNARGDAGD